jgi:hypothetical protein
MNDKTRTIFELPKELRLKPLDKPIESHKPAEKLAAVGFDPIAQMVQLHCVIQDEIIKMTTACNEDGTIKNYSKIAVGQLLSIQQKISNDLLRYGYSRITETVDVNNNNTSQAPLQIMLTGSNEFSLPKA